MTSNNLNGPKGSFDGPTRASTLDANDQLRSADAYRDLIIAYKNGSPLRIRDVASVEDDAENVRLAAWANNLPAVVLNIQRQPGANVIEVVDRIKALLPQLQSTLPGNLDVQVLTDRTTTIRASVKDVQFELALAVALVVMVTFLFLRNVYATLIPSFAVPLSLIGLARTRTAGRWPPLMLTRPTPEICEIFCARRVSTRSWICGSGMPSDITARVRIGASAGFTLLNTGWFGRSLGSRLCAALIAAWTSCRSRRCRKWTTRPSRWSPCTPAPARRS